MSVDTADSHKSFCAKEGLNFKLLADTDVVFRNMVGEDYNGAKLSARNTSSSIRRERRQRFVKVSPAGHSDEVLAALAELQKS